MVQYGKGQVSDREDILDFGNYVFSQAHQPHDFKKLVPKLYGEDSHTEQYHYLAKEDGKIKAMICALPGRLVVAGQELKTSGIGTVSVHPYSRGRGYMKRLMAMTNEYARENGFDLLALGGQRQRYEYYGYEPGGTAHSLLITPANCRHALKDVDGSGVSFAPFESLRAEMDSLFALYESGVVAGARPRNHFEQICGTWRNQPLAILQSGAVAGYLIASADRSRILELRCKAPEQALYPAIKAYLASYAPQGVRIELPPHQTELLRPLLRICESASIEQNECFRIVNYARVARAYLLLKQRIEGGLPDGRFALGLAEDGVTLSLGVLRGEISCEITRDAPDILLSRLEAQNLLLAPTPFVDVSALPDCARRFFPLPVCIASADGF